MGIRISNKFPVGKDDASLRIEVENQIQKRGLNEEDRDVKEGSRRKNFCPGEEDMQSGATDAEMMRADVRLGGRFWMEKCRAQVHPQLAVWVRHPNDRSG